MNIRRFLKKVVRNVWLFFTCGYGGLYWKDEIRKIDEKINKELFKK